MTDAEIMEELRGLVDRIKPEFDGMHFVVVIGDPEAGKIAVAGNIPATIQIGMLAAGIGFQTDRIKKGEK